MTGEDNMGPLVSVLMTSYNCEQYIAEAIESVLASTYKNFEMIIVDDQSKDNSVEIARSYENKDSRIRVYVNEENLGDYPNRNKAASYAKGKYLKYVDCDNVIYYYTLDVMVNFMERFPEAGFGLCTISYNRVLPYFSTPYETYYSQFFDCQNHFDRPAMASIINRDIFIDLGGFSGERWTGDNEFNARISRYHGMVVLPKGLYFYRLREGQELDTINRKVHQRMTNKVFHEALRHSDCPLLKDDIKRLRRSQRSFKNIVKKMINAIRNFN